MRFDCSGIQAGDIKQGIEQQLHGSGGRFDVVDQRLRLGLLITRLECGDKQGECMHRLPQIVAGRSKETRLGKIGAFGHVLFCGEAGSGYTDPLFQFAAMRLQGFGHVVNPCCQCAHLAHWRKLGARGQIVAGEPSDHLHYMP